MRTLSALATLALLLTACGGDDSEPTTEPTPPSFAATADKCQPENEQARMESDATSLTVSVVPPTTSEDEARLGAVVSCVVGELGGPGTVSTQVGGTTGNDGQQSASWSGFDAEWVFDASSVGLVFLVKSA